MRTCVTFAGCAGSQCFCDVIRLDAVSAVTADIASTMCSQKEALDVTRKRLGAVEREIVSFACLVNTLQGRVREFVALLMCFL